MTAWRYMKLAEKLADDDGGRISGDMDYQRIIGQRRGVRVEAPIVFRGVVEATRAVNVDTFAEHRQARDLDTGSRLE